MPYHPTPDAQLFAELLRLGTSEHYEDPVLYDHEYRRRRGDVNHYRALCREVGAGGPTRVLELGCGSGRLLVPLLRDGHTVLGVDRSRPMLARCAGRIGRLHRGKQARAGLLQADFRDLPLCQEGAGGRGRFPLILCPFNAFMHLYTRTDVERCLAQVRAHLSPGGLFAFDVLHPDLDWLNRDPERRWSRTRFRHPTSGERLIYTTNHSYDPVHQIAMVRIYYEPDDPAGPARPAQASRAGLAEGARVVHLTQRHFFPAELEALLHYNGFAIQRHDGGFDGEPLAPGSYEQVIRARVR